MVLTGQRTAGEVTGNSMPGRWPAAGTLGDVVGGSSRQGGSRSSFLQTTTIS
jgi:hypothetical protein